MLHPILRIRSVGEDEHYDSLPDDVCLHATLSLHPSGMITKFPTVYSFFCISNHFRDSFYVPFLHYPPNSSSLFCKRQDGSGEASLIPSHSRPSHIPTLTAFPSQYVDQVLDLQLSTGIVALYIDDGSAPSTEVHREPFQF